MVDINWLVKLGNVNIKKITNNNCNRLPATVFPKRFAGSARIFSPFFDSLVFGCGAAGLSKLSARAIYNAALASLS